MSSSGADGKPMPRFQAGPDRAQLEFVDVVRSGFEFLERRGFKVARSEQTFVRFESNRVFVNVFHGRGSYELGVEIGPCERAADAEVSYSLLEIVLLNGDPNVLGHWPIQVSTSDATARGVARLAELTSAYADAALEGNDHEFTRLATQSARQSRELTESYTAISLRRQADQVWRDRDYVGVLAAYHTLEELNTVRLTKSEQKRVDYAKKQLDT
jgi:hypothetical protein